MRFLIFSIIALMSSVALANNPTATHKFTLNRPFEMVIPLTKVNAEILLKQMGGEVVTQKVGKVKIDLNFIDKDHSVIIFKQKNIKVKIPGVEEETTIKFEESSVIRLNQIIITTTLIEKNDIIQYSKNIIEFNRVENKTEVNMKMWIKVKDTKTFWIRIFSRVKLKKFEKKIREIVGDLLPEKD